MTAPHSTARAVKLGFALKQARERAGMTQEATAALLGRNRSHVSRFERAQLVPRPDEVAAMADLYQVTDEERERLIRLAHEAAQLDWVIPGVDRSYATLIEVERDAERIVNVEPLLIPGLLQTAAYARPIMTGAGLTPEQAEERIRIRMARQALLEREDAPQYVAIIGTHALRFMPCDRTAATGQLRRLLEIAQRPNVSIHVLTSEVGYCAALEGAFVLVDPRRGDAQVHKEGYRATTTLTNSRDVRDYQAAVNTMIRRQVMGTVASAALIGSLLEGMEGNDI